jgi:hypothetical protein
VIHRFEDDEWGVTHQRVIGYRAACPCSWRGDFRTRMIDARADARTHNGVKRPWGWPGEPAMTPPEQIYRDALERIVEAQPNTLAMIERNGFVFDSIGREPGNWQHLAFSIYTDLCEVDLIARTALEETA